MSWQDNYHPPDNTIWQGRTDAPTNACFYQIIQCVDIQQLPTAKPHSFILIGFCCDEGIKRNLGRVGAHLGPDAIRKALSNFPLQKQNFTCFDAGNIVCHQDELEQAQLALSEVVALALQKGLVPIVLGGGHEVAYGHFLGLKKIIGNKSIGIVNLDAHIDMRPLLPKGQGTSGTPFLQIANLQKKTSSPFDYNCIGIQHAGNIKLLFETAKEHDVKILLADDLHQEMMDKCVNFVDRVVDHNPLIYLSICLDVFASAFAPGVSAPQPLGLLPWQAIPIIRQLASSGKVISYDIAELSPPLDPDGRTAKLAATLIYEIIHAHIDHRKIPREQLPI